jgi:hypothetical protein
MTLLGGQFVDAFCDAAGFVCEEGAAVVEDAGTGVQSGAAGFFLCWVGLAFDGFGFAVEDDVFDEGGVEGFCAGVV